jgi:hypothetical protein
MYWVVQIMILLSYIPARVGKTGNVVVCLIWLTYLVWCCPFTETLHMYVYSSNANQLLYFIWQYRIKVTILWSWQHTRPLVLRYHRHLKWHHQQPTWRHRMRIQENLSDRRQHSQFYQQGRVCKIAVSWFVLPSRWWARHWYCQRNFISWFTHMWL